MQKLNKYLLFINLFFLQSYLLRFPIGPYPSNLQEVLIGLNFLAFICTRPKIHWKKHWISGLLIALTLISTFANEIISSIDLIRHGKFLFFASIFSFIFIETFKKEDEQIKALRIAGFGALTFGIFSLIFNLTGHNVTHDLRLLGPLDSAVYLAYYLTPFFIFFAIRKEIWPALLLGLLIIATRSMGAIGGSFIVISSFFLYRRKLSRNVKMGLAVIGAIIAVAIFYIKILPTLQTNYSSLDERGEIWKVSAEILKENPIFGVGPGQFEANFIKESDEVLGRPPLDYYVIQPHNIFLLFWFNYGILGISLLIFLIYKIFHLKEKTVIHSILLYLLIHGLIDTPFYKNDLLILIILLLNLSKPLPDRQLS